MKISPLIKDQETFEKYLKENSRYRDDLLYFRESYNRYFGQYSKGENILTVPKPLDFSNHIPLCAIIQLEEDIYFMGHKIQFN